MHGSLHMILANESVRARIDDAEQAGRSTRMRRSVASLASAVARAHGIPPRAHPGAAPASLRGR
jgi:hypothetical protein